MPSIIDFKSYKPTFIGKPVDELATMMKSTAERQQRVYDTTSTMDMMLSETSENLEPTELYRVDEARTKIKESLGELANATDHRTSDVKLNKMVLDLNKDKGLNAAMTKSANYKKWGDDANKRVTDGNLNRSVYESIREKSKYEPVKADKFGYYDTRVENDYQTALGGGNTAGYNFAPIVDLNKKLKDGHANLMTIDTGVPRLMLNKQGMAFVQYPKEGRYGIGAGNKGKENYVKDLKTILMSDESAVAYMQDIAIAKGNDYDVDRVATDMATSYAINNSAVQNMDRYVQYTPSTVDGSTSSNEVSFSEVSKSEQILNDKRGKMLAILSKKNRSPQVAPKYQMIGDYQYPLPETNMPIVETYGYDDVTDMSVKTTINNIAKYHLDKDLTKLKGEDRNKAFDDTYKFIDSYYNDVQASAYTENIPNVTIKSIDDKYTGSDAMVQYIFGTNKLEEFDSGRANIAGSFAHRKFYNPTTGEVVDGTKFKTDILDEMDKNANISISNMYNYKNPFVFSTNDKDFAKCFEVVIGGETFIMSMAQGADPIGDFNNPTSKMLSTINSLKYASDAEPFSYGKDYKVHYRPDTKNYELLYKDESLLKGDEIDIVKAIKVNIDKTTK